VADSTLVSMGIVVDFSAWLEGRAGEAKDESQDIVRLEGAVEHLYPLVMGALDRRGGLSPRLETELLAIMGEMTMGLVAEATARADRLAEELGTRSRARRG
jgi:hypothetical protein